MDGLPSMWRVELWHPLVVHFPIALLLVGTTLRLLGLSRRRRARWRFLVPAGRLLLVVGVVSAWIAVYTGTLADAVVVRSLCDPTVVEAHEDAAYWVAALFTLAALADGFLAWRRPDGWRRRLLILFLAGSSVAGSAGLLYVGHLGARLVYQQAAAVHVPSADCHAFE
jgi:uncharacterized membrane protein